MCNLYPLLPDLSSHFLNQTPGEGVCVSHVAPCAVLRPPAPPKAPHNVRVPAKGRADRVSAWAYGAARTGAPGSHLTQTLGEVARAPPGAFGGA